ncbi:MAG: hypothetical protein AAGG68_26625 [Bacteroidota bacterium]
MQKQHASPPFLAARRLDAYQLQLLHTNCRPRVLFAIRSDRMSLLDRISDYLPIVKRAWYELYALTELQAEEAIYNPAYKEGNFRTPIFDYSDDTIDAILNYLTKDHQQKIESFQLQILCQAIERKVEQQGLTFVQRSDLGNIQTVYENYYDDQIQQLASPEDQLAARRFIEYGLVLEEEERRLSLYEGQIKRQYGLSDELLAQLVNTHIIRREPSLRGGYVYELSHDTLVKPILKAKQALVAMEEEDRQAKLLKEERKKRRRANLIAIAGITLAVLAIIASILAIRQTAKANAALEAQDIALKEAKAAEEIAEAEAKRATENEEKALANLDFANRETTRANQEADAAKQARIKAEVNELRALESERIAQSRAERAARLRTTLSVDNAYDYLLTTGTDLFTKGDYRNALTYFANARFVGTVDTLGKLIEACAVGIGANELYMAGKLRKAEKVYKRLMLSESQAKQFSEMQIRYLNISLEAYEEALAGKKMEEVDSLHFKASVLDILPKEIAYLKNLNLGSNDLDDLPQNLLSFKQLEILDLSSNNFQRLSESFVRLSYLRTLDLSNNDALSALPESFGSLSQLQTLDLSSNSALSALPESIGNLDQLQTLDLSYNSALSVLPESIGNLSQLQTLDLNSNSALSALPESIGNLSQLQTLYLGDNEALSALPESIGNLSQLQALYLSYNPALSALPESIGNLSQLQTLYLTSNALSALPESIGKLENLGWLDLRNTPKLTDLEPLAQLEQSIEIINRTEYLRPVHKEDQLTIILILSAELETLPKGLQSLKNLKRLDARNSNFSEEYKAQLREWLPWCELVFE